MQSQVIVNVAMETRKWRKDAILHRIMVLDTKHAKTHAPDTVDNNLNNFDSNTTADNINFHLL
jgi:hypothetical protein